MTRKEKFGWVVWVALGMSLISLPAVSAPVYTQFIDLGVVCDQYSYAASVNDSDQVVGGQVMSGTTYPFIWSPAIGPQVLDQGGYLGGQAEKITNEGYVAGTINSPGAERVAFWDNGAITHLYTIQDQYGGHGGRCVGTGVNGSKTVVGYGATTYGPWKAGSTTPPVRMQEIIPTLGGTYSAAFDVIDNGVIYGYAAVAGDGNYYAAKWVGGTCSRVDTNSTYNYVSSVQRANEQGMAVGWTQVTATNQWWERHPVRFNADGTVTMLGSIDGAGYGGIAYDINESGIIVGRGWDFKSNHTGFVWQNGVMYNLNSLLPAGVTSVYITEAHGINNLGHVTGQYWDQVGGQYRAFLLVPEPTMIILFLMGALAVFRRRV